MPIDVLLAVPTNSQAMAPDFEAFDADGKKGDLWSLFREANIAINLNPVVVSVEAQPSKWTVARLDAVHSEVREEHDLRPTDVVLICASSFTTGSLAGLMFDHSGRRDSNGIPRQACAVFTRNSRVKKSKRNYLWTAVHELGHVFNLTHGSGNHFMRDVMPGRVRFQFDSGDTQYLNRYPEDPCATPGTSCAFRGSDTARTGRPGGKTWSLELEVDSDEYELGQPVVATMTLARASSQGASVSYPVMHGDGALSYEVQKDRGSWSKLQPLSQPCMVHRRRYLRGRSRLFHNELLHLGADGPYFKEPGAYRLRVIYSGLPGRREVSAESQEFTVGSSGSGLGALLHSPLPARIVQWRGGRHLGSARKELAEHTSDDSPLAPYARFARAAAYEVNEASDLEGLSKNGATDLRRNLEACLERGMPGALELLAVRDLAHLEREGHSSSKAQRLVTEATKRWRSSPELGSLIRALKKVLAD